MKSFRRVALIVMDSVGIGPLPDADSFGDSGANTIGHIREKVGLELPNLSRLGLGQITDLPEVDPVGGYGKMAEKSAGKDTTSGHWEIAGVPVEIPFKTYPNGFPKDFIDEFERAVGRKTVCNQPASGTVVIGEYGEHHEKTGDLIVYTSADSVFQIAAHEKVVPLEELYSICQTARDMLRGEYQVGRIIARPFVGEKGNYTRTANRRDYSLEPPSPTILDEMSERGLEVSAVGKISDIFAGRGITWSVKTTDNQDGVDKTLARLQEQSKPGIIFTNLIDFDSLYGHRRNPEGYKNALEEFDQRVPELQDALREDDLLIITADHGNDPTHPGTDHTREYTPLLVYHREIEGTDLGIRQTFADIACTLGENFELPPREGTSFLAQL